MPTEITLPRLSGSMTAGSVVAWRKRPGDAVKAGEVVAEVEADKTTADVEAPADGTLGPILAPAGSPPVAVGTVLARIFGPGEPQLATDMTPHSDSVPVQ